MVHDLTQPTDEQRRPVAPRAAAEGNANDAIHSDDQSPREILDFVAVGILRVGPGGKVLFANAHARRLLELQTGEVESRSLDVFERFTIWQDGTPCKYEDYPAIQCLRTGQPQPPVTIGLRRARGDVSWVSVTAAPFRDPRTGQADSVIVTFSDISRPIQVEESLRQIEDRYYRLVEQAPDAIVVHRAGLIIYLNDAAVKLWGGESREQLLGCDIFAFVHPKYQDLARRRVERVMRGESMPLIDQKHVRLDGRIVHVEVTGTSCVYDGQPSVQVIFRDVTRRKRIERQLRRQREILIKFFDRIPLLVGFFSIDGRITRVNREWKRVLGWDRGLSVNQLLCECYPDPTERQRAVEIMRTAAAGWHDFRVRVRDGRTLDISWANIVLSDGTRIGIGQDITARKNAELGLQQTNAELEEGVMARTEELSNKNLQLEREVSERRRAESQLKQKQRFLQRLLDTHERDRQLVAYEIHDTFLQDVIGALMQLDTFYDLRLAQSQSQRQGEDLSQLELARRLLRKSIDEARRMISGLRPPIIDEQGIVAAIEYLVSEMNDRGLEIRFVHTSGVPRLAPVLEAAVFRIVQEGLTNIERHSSSPFAQVKLTQNDRTLRLQIQDFGVGFDPEQTEEGHYGLQGIRERTRLLGGTFSVLSSPGQGTELNVEIPLLPPELP